ncbi:MAG: citramalate synthase [Alphaproteobacteria bacterium]|nr:citramalate synthase [Alphaproteobacteria bacterium]
MEARLVSRERVYLFDTTLRDGAQTQGVDFSVHDKTTMARALDALGIDYVEGGWPGANPTDSAFFAEAPRLERARLTAFGMTRRPGRSAENDPGLTAVLAAGTKAICLVGKTWDFHVATALGVSREENLDLIGSSLAAVVKRGAEALFDAEHFFDGYKADPGYALACLDAAVAGGARWVVLCDTNGGTLPEEVERIVGEAMRRVPAGRLAIHAHDDTGNAVANALAALRAGCRQIQGSLNGLGERCGNTNLVTVIPTLMLKAGYRDRYEIGVTPEALKGLTRASRLLDELLTRSPNRHAPYVGASAFAHKGGLHASAVAKDPTTYEHVPPESVGNVRQILVSDQAGRSNILAQLAGVGIDLAPDDARIGRLLSEVKEREFRGYTYDGADASFELLARRALGQVPEYFRVNSYRALVERRINAKGEEITLAEATVKVTVDGQLLMSVAEGNGPVSALDAALRKDLGKFSRFLEDLRLVDFRVRILNQGTGAVTRVMVESMDGRDRSWFTVGVSTNIVDASFQALYDAIVYKLYRDGAPAGEG